MALSIHLYREYLMENLFEAAHRCLMSCDIEEKLRLTEETVAAWRTNSLSMTDDTATQRIEEAGIPTTLRLVPPRELPRRRLGATGGKVALLHAISHIEFNAINLAWDAVYRFRNLPTSYYSDWIKVGHEEAYHFRLLHEQLNKEGVQYGDMVAHNGLWEMAVKTDHDVMVRMALVPRVLEARGLDATPAIMRKLKQHNSPELIDILTIILRDEVGHVAIGTHWFHHFCQQRGCEPDSTFKMLLKQYYSGQLRPPFNTEARLAAGFTSAEIESLENL